MEKAWLKIKNWILANKWESFILLGILLIGAFVRLYRIDQYMIFLGDEGRDVIVVRRIFTELHPPLIGPGTSIGNMNLGPLYYYMMAPALLLANFSPVGPAVMVALLGVATIFLVCWVAREWFGKIAAIVAAGLYAISLTVIIYSSSSWNPNIMPFFALLSIYSIWRVYKDNEFKWLIVLGISYAFVLQSHYLGLLLFPVILLFWLLTIREIRNSKFEINNKLRLRNFLQQSFLSLLIFAGLMSPLLFFDLRHNWQNFSAMKKFVTESSVSFSAPVGSLKRFVDVFVQFNTRLIGGRNQVAGIAVSIVFAIYILWSLVRFKSHKLPASSYLLYIWYLVGLFGLSRYKGEIFDHYMGFLFPAPFLLLGQIVQVGIESRKITLRAGAILFVAGLMTVALKAWPLKWAPNRQLQRAEEIAAFIKEKSGGERFNLATLSDMNNRDVYQYFLQLWGTKIVDTDPNAVKYTVTDQLFVVCERPLEKCDPTHDPSAWITNFGWTKIVDKWNVAGYWIFKLAHAK